MLWHLSPFSCPLLLGTSCSINVPLDWLHAIVDGWIMQEQRKDGCRLFPPSFTSSSGSAIALFFCTTQCLLSVRKRPMSIDFRHGHHGYPRPLSPPQVCTSCSPAREWIRLFDVTERTALHRHGTGRFCGHCGGQLCDTIVHFGERGTLEQPLNWEGAVGAAGTADTILCLGSSLKVRCATQSNALNSRRGILFDLWMSVHSKVNQNTFLELL